MGSIAKIDLVLPRLVRRDEAHAKRHASRAGSTYARFIRAIADEAGILFEDAEQVAVAVIATLEERLPLRDVFGLESQLPSRLAEMLEREPILDLPHMGRGQLCTRVAIRLGITIEEATALTRVVFRILEAHVSAGEARRIERALSDEFRSLWGVGADPREGQRARTDGLRRPL